MARQLAARPIGSDGVIYARLAGRGYGYGPSFRGWVEAWRVGRCRVGRAVPCGKRRLWPRRRRVTGLASAAEGQGAGIVLGGLSDAGRRSSGRHSCGIPRAVLPTPPLGLRRSKIGSDVCWTRNGWVGAGGAAESRASGFDWTRSGEGGEGAGRPMQLADVTVVWFFARMSGGLRLEGRRAKKGQDSVMAGRAPSEAQHL